VSRKPFQFTLRQLLVFTAGCAVLCSALRTFYVRVDAAREAARQASCQGNMNQLAMALFNKFLAE
jgi:hypothetical protein